MSLRGLPDWNKPLVAGGAFAAYGQPGVWFAAPARLEPAARGGLIIDRFAQDRGDDGGIVRYGVHTLRWLAVTDVDGAAIPGPSHVGVPPRPLPFGGGLVRLTGPAALREARTGEPALGEVSALDQAGLATFVAVLNLDDASTDLVIDAHRRGTALIGADAVLVARGVAARQPAVVEIDLATFTAAIDGDGGGDDGVVEVARLGEWVADAPESLGIRFVTGAPADDVAAAHAVAAVCDRIVARLATPLAPASRETDALALGARIPARVRIGVPAEGRLRWDLSEPLVAPRLFGLASSGLLPGSDPAEVREHTPPTLSSGWHRLEVSTTAVPPWAGALLGMDVVVPPNPPARPQGIRKGELFAGAAQATVDLRLTPREVLSGTVTGTVVFDSGEQAAGEPIPLVQSAVLLRTDAFPARFIPLGLAGGLLGCDVSVEWSRIGASPEATAHLGADVPRLLLVTPRAEDATLRVHAVAADGRTATAADLPAVSLLVDEFLFPGTGAQAVLVEVTFDDASPATVSVELVPEGAEDDLTAPVLRNFARGQPSSEWTRFVASPFATGYRWRIAGDESWSDVVRTPPGTPLRVPATGVGNGNEMEDDVNPSRPSQGDPSMETKFAGLRMLAAGDVGGREWVFVPETPAIATQPGGGQSMSLIEAGGNNLLTLTGRFTASEEQHVRAREELGERHGIPPEQVVLRPATLTNPSASVTITVDGVATEVANSTTSGLWPYNAVFQAQLTALQADAVRRAWDGERGLLNLHYEGELRTGAAESSISSSSSSSSSVSTTVSTTTRTGDGPAVTGSSSTEHSETGARTVAPSVPTVRPITIDLDGADWTKPQHHR